MGTGGKVTWLFEARNVRDFAWGTSDKYLWDATHAVVGTVGCLPTSLVRQRGVRPAARLRSRQRYGDDQLALSAVAHPVGVGSVGALCTSLDRVPVGTSSGRTRTRR